MKNVKTNRIISSIIIAMMVVTSLIIPVSASPTETLPSYQSSVGFSTESGDGTWADGVWSATKVDTTANTYTTITGTGTRTGTCWQQDGVTVNALEIVPYAGSKANAVANNHIGAAKTFTAPHSGKIAISYAAVANSVEPTTNSPKENVGVSVFQINKQMSFRVRRQAGTNITKIYPADAEYVNSLTNWSTTEMVPANTVTAEITVSKGDKIHFEVKKTAADGDNWNGIFCDPIVTYTEVFQSPEERDFFTASEKFDLTSGGSWDDGVWQAMFYEWEESTYKQMTLTKGTNYISHDEVNGDYKFYSWGDRAVHQAATYMREEQPSHHPNISTLQAAISVHGTAVYGRLCTMTLTALQPAKEISISRW